MNSIYEINEYNQNSDIDEKFTDTKFPIFESLDKLEQYLNKNFIYGKVFEYDKEEYLQYENATESESIYMDIPEPINEWDT